MAMAFAFSKAVKSLVEKRGIPIMTIGAIKPFGAAINQMGEVVITEFGINCVSTFSPSPSGEKLRSFGTFGFGPGQFVNPADVAVDGEGSILVVDFSNQRIQKFTQEGQLLAGLESLPSNPTCIAFNASNNRVYVGYTDHVQVLKSDLTNYSKFGDEGQLNYVRGIACDSTGKVYVVDSNNHRIQVFTAEGVLLRMFGKHCQVKGDLYSPNAVAIDSCDMVYVSQGTFLRNANHDNHCISVFTSEGQFVTSFGRKGDGPGEFKCPRGVVVDTNGLVYVCDEYNNRIQVF